ncbi:hypothetical protein CPB84DRAFT_1722037 [Gymnopilus junonius]|uniref:UBC core domain-containing protein n=1 Tax=Gymnopilus junonius TaxID=109634 RepID=A0A9P5TTC0_GYMJU|nr:hypothetical protein CPB84DRAFT_1722037 [Gymnopilus junonius]
MQVQSPMGTKLFQQDIVQKISSPGNIGIVLRCWHDAEEVPPVVPHVDPLMRPLSYGEVGVTFISSGGQREILPQSDLHLVDRALHPGDYCKRSFDDVRAGVVTNIKVKGRISHAINGAQVEGWRFLQDLEDRADAEVGDYVAFDDWIGQIIEVFDESIIQVSSGQLVRLPEMGSRLTVGETGTNILSPQLSATQIGSLGHNGGKDVVLAVKHNTYAISWLAVNQALDIAITENKSRPKQFWSGEDLEKLTLVRGHSDLEMRVGDRVYLKDTTGLPFTEHGKQGDMTGVVQVRTFLVTETSTEVEVLWQDGTKESLNAVDVIPYLNPDEYDCWPGDHVVFKNEEEKRPAIVQSVNAAERTAYILFPDTGNIELASLLELDAHGNSDHDANNPQAESFGVRRGDFVFIHALGTTNRLENPRVPRIGEIEPWVRENPFSHGELSGWRKELQDIGCSIATRRTSDHLQEKLMQRPITGDGKLSWCGEVTGLNLNGTVEVTHPDGTAATYSLERLTRLHDGIEQLEDDVWDAGSEDYHSYSDDDDWDMDTEGQSQIPLDDYWDISSTGGIRGDDDANVEDLEDDDEADLMEVDQALWSPEAEIPIPDTNESNIPDLPRFKSSNQEADPHLSEVSTPMIEYNEDDVKWNRFEILASAPPDHAFYSSPPSQPSKIFLGRISREYRVLRSSLPDSILVRAYEDRTDLLRCLIIGPDNTPYQDAPFVIDWMLDSNFPHSPPIAHFLSWTNGNGRVNPNLYEEGKVCLSILGTWSGDKNEIWSAARSSLLQAFVSIQGLVLVKEPWFCEPAYDKLRGTEEGIVNSRLYSEKAYVLSRGFVRRALEIPLGGLEAEITQLYRTGRRLQKVIDDAERLIQKSKDNAEIAPEDIDLAVPRLSAGGIITLERTLAKLRRLL